MANLKVTLVKSTIGAVPKHKKTVEALGLRKVNKDVYKRQTLHLCLMKDKEGNHGTKS